MKPTIAVSSFVRRQTPESRFSHFSGSWDELITRVAAKFDRAVPGYRGGVVLVPVESEGFFSATVLLQEGDKFAGVYEARQPGEQPRKATGVVGGQKMPARRVQIVLYSRGALAENNENTPGSCGSACTGATCRACDGTTFADWEVISVNATPTDEDEPMPVGTLMHNHFHVEGSNDGGTSTGMSDAEFVAALRRSHAYWKDKASIAPKV